MIDNVMGEIIEKQYIIHIQYSLVHIQPPLNEFSHELLCCLSAGMFLGIHDNEKLVSPLIPCYEFGCALSNYLFVLPQNYTEFLGIC